MPLHERAPPRVDLLVDIDLHRTDIGAAAVERRGEWQVAVFPRVERRIDDEADRAGIGGAIAQAAAAAVDRAGVHAGAAADTLEGRSELRHAQALGSTVV